jgi:hypothetical protein
MAYGFPTNYPVICTTTTDDASAATVQSAIDAAASGSVVCVAAGTASWTGTGSLMISGNKNIVLAGAAAWGGGTTTIAGGSPQILNTSSPWQGSRITGFTFDLNNSYIILTGAVGYRIDHNILIQPAWAACILALGSLVAGVSASPTEGLIDHNTMTNCRFVSYGESTDTGGHQRWVEQLALGTSHNNYLEDNTMVNTDSAIHNAADGNHGGRYAARFNTMTNHYFEAHSIQEVGRRAHRLVEIYYNTLNLSGISGFARTGLFRGGVGMVFHNTHNGALWGASPHYDMDNVRSCDDTRNFSPWGHCGLSDPIDSNSDGSGYMCRDQPGASTDAFFWRGNGTSGFPIPSQQRTPWVFFKNIVSDPDVEIGVSLNTCTNAARLAEQIVKNRQYYLYQTTFNGTSGVGEGTLASRPESCTPGVFYWATDQGEWNSIHAGADGQLYRCTATATWSLYYTPYFYPHPLQAGGGNGSNPSAPSNLRVQ